MKKRKTYEVSVINKTYSKTYSDQTKFYTSDTALELNFQLKEVEYDFDSGEIILLNVDDRSLITRPVGKSAEGFTYELEDDIVARYGEWKGQLKFNEGGEIYVSSPVSFRIENDLSNDRPPQLTEVNNWKELRNIADGLISDMRSEIEVLEAQELEVQTAEQSRQSAEQQRVEAESLRVERDVKREAEITDWLAGADSELTAKANKKQEDWITLPLYNGVQHGVSPLKVMKDEMGFVHFKGSLTNLVTGSKVFSLPIGYRPDIGATERYIRASVALSSGQETNVVQINYVGDGYIINPLSTTVAFFDSVSYLAKRG